MIIGHREDSIKQLEEGNECIYFDKMFRGKEMKWTTKDGREIDIKDMNTRHISNTINMLKRKGFIGKSTFEFYLFGPRPTGDMATYYYEQECDRIFSCPIHPALDDLEEELERREK